MSETDLELRLGNPHAPGAGKDGETRVLLPAAWSTLECFQTVTLPGGVGDNHLGDNAPTWVACPDRPGLADLLAEHYDCEVRA